ncbi:MAG: HIT domain-containing protein [Rhodothermales bacterium]|nr:HIT domain-containing protein [Rhodothermales bacterium]
MAEERTLFERIIERDIPAEILYEDDHCVGFRDINPQAPVHVLIVPRRPIPTLDDLTDDDQALAGHLLLAARRVAEQEGLEAGYRVVINCKEHGLQSVAHLHLHLLGGRKMKWPPG